MKNVNEMQLGDWVSYSVGSDRYPGRVVDIQRFKDGRVKALQVQDYSFRLGQPYSGYPADDWKDDAKPEGHPHWFKVAVSGRYKGHIRHMGLDDAHPYRDPHF